MKRSEFRVLQLLHEVTVKPVLFFITAIDPADPTNGGGRRERREKYESTIFGGRRGDAAPPLTDGIPKHSIRHIVTLVKGVRQIMKNLKLPNDAYVFRLTDDTGMFQHARRAVPDPSEGYTTDDNARALIMALQLFGMTGKQKYLDLAVRYLGFLAYAKNGAWFRNFMDYDRRFTEERGSEECFGRCIAALGFAASRPGLPEEIRGVADDLLRQTVSGCGELTHLRAEAYAVIGLNDWKGDHSREFAVRLAAEISDAYGRRAAPDWKWFEDEINYCNAVLPWAMLIAHEATGEKKYLRIGMESLDFLLDATFADGIFRPVGCNGWFPKGQKAAEFDQQPVEACGTLLACLKAYELTGKDVYRDRASQCLGWYTGRNIRKVSLIDPETGGCLDGITSGSLNPNEGAESLVCWMIASLAWLAFSKSMPRPSVYAEPAAVAARI